MRCNACRGVSQRQVFFIQPCCRDPSPTIPCPTLQAGDLWVGTLNLRFSKQASPAPAHGRQVPLGPPTRLLPLPFTGGTFNSTYNVVQPVFKFVTPRHLLRAVITSVITGGRRGWLGMER